MKRATANHYSMKLLYGKNGSFDSTRVYVYICIYIYIYTCISYYTRASLRIYIYIYSCILIPVCIYIAQI